MGKMFVVNVRDLILRVHNRFGGMQDLAILRGDTRDAS